MPGSRRTATATSRTGTVVLAVSLAGAALLLAACEPTLRQASGVVIEIDSPALGRVDSFTLLTAAGERLEFDSADLRFRPEFPASHLSEHRVIGDTIVVTYKKDGERLVVTQLDDAGH